MRKTHYWKAAGRTAAPSEILVFDCETRAGPESMVDGGEFHRLRLGCAVAYRLERGRRTRQDKLHFREPDELWSFIAGRLSRQRPLHVFGHNLAYDLAAADVWPRLESERFACSKAILEGGILLIEGEYDGKGIVFCDTFNYYKCSLSTIGASLGLPKGTMPDWAAPDDEWYDYCMRDVEVTALAVDRLIAFVRENELGPWQPTIASLAFSAFRRRFMSHKVLVHSYPEPLRVERAAYYGGIVDTRYVGEVKSSPVHELDVVSMYPHVCTFTLPAVFKGWSDALTVDGLADKMTRYFVTADVEIDTPDETYPYRVGKRVYYVTGRFRTCLSHPELQTAVRAGHVVGCHAATWHTRETIFKDYMEFFTRKKGEYRAAGNDAFAAIAKYYANSLYGKAGQLTPRWAAWDGATFEEIERQNGLRPGTLSKLASNPPPMSGYEGGHSVPEYGLRLELRHLFGLLEVKIGQTESRDSCPAVAAAVTSYARTYLRGLQRAAGDGNVYYSDTDSLWVSDAGLERLARAGHVVPGVLGKLEHKGTYQRMHIFAPKDYVADDVIKTKGVRRNAGVTSDGRYVQLQFPSAKEMLLGGHSGGVYCPIVVKRLRRANDHCVTGPDGWTRPWRVGAGGGFF